MHWKAASAEDMWLQTIFRKKSDIPVQDFSIKNGEILLQKQISFSQGRSNPIRTFTLRELREATRDFDQGCLVGSSCFCKHYRGILDDREVVVGNANGNSGGGDDDEDRLVQEYITEIVLLSNIRHRNMVRLLGFCLETRVPLLVFEFVPGRDLWYNLERWGFEPTPEWPTRLQIAIDVADALNYLHCYTSRPVVYKNVMSQSIILDEDNTAKLAGFWCSVPIPPGKTQVEEDGFRGGVGHPDPEYVTTCIVTEKVDIYAFGVLLLELLTGANFFNSLYEHLFKMRASLQGLRDPLMPHLETVITSEEHTREHELALEEACLEKLVADAGPLGDAEGNTEQFRAFAKLALRCAWPRMRQRPTMKEVVEELRRIRSYGAPLLPSAVPRHRPPIDFGRRRKCNLRCPKIM